MRIKTANVLFAAAVLATPVQAQAPDRSRPPDLGPAPSLNLPEIQRFELSNGLRVMLMEKHNVPLVQVDLVVHSGTVDDPRGKTGLASLTAAMMDEGAGDRDALELADAIEFLGADILVGAGLHVSWVDLHTPLAQLEPALELYADVILRPTFAAEELDRQRRNRLTSIMQWHDEARVIASQMFNRVLFGDDHPYGVPGFG
ncbi:MAG: M16 family metallopeptidase, partial [Gemmatimonadales bacterium]